MTLMMMAFRAHMIFLQLQETISSNELNASHCLPLLDGVS